MNRNIIIYIGILLLLVVGISHIESVAPKPINWSPSFKTSDKIPFGLYVFDKESKKLFQDCTIEKLKVSPYEFFSNDFVYDSLDTQSSYSKRGTFFYVNKQTKIDKQSMEELLYYVSYGNNAFISAEDFPRELLDSLKVNQVSEYLPMVEVTNSLTHPKFAKKSYKFKEGANFAYFDKFDKNTTAILGKLKVKDSTYTNFIKVKYYNGNFYLHNQPSAFTNFHLLHKNKNYEYASNIASHLPKGNLYWHTGDISDDLNSPSPMRYILSQPALRWAWYLFLLGVLGFIIFNAKRKQRVVPIIKPLPNTTIDFVKTIGNLYYQEADYDNIIEKKIIYFLERVRNEYVMDTSKLDEHFINKLHQKTGKSVAEIEHAVYLIKKFKNSPHQSIESDLIEIVNTLENLLHKA